MNSICAKRKTSFRILVNLLLAAPVLLSARPALSTDRQQIHAHAAEEAGKRDVYLPVAMATREIARGEVVPPDALVMKRYNVSTLRGEPLLSREAAAGLIAKRTLRPWRPLLRAQLEQPLLVKRGQTVTIVSQTGDIRAQTVGVALKAGRLHDTIRVQNSGSERIVDASVAGPGEVHVGRH